MCPETKRERKQRKVYIEWEAGSWQGGRAHGLSAGPGSVWIMDRNSARRKDTLDSPLNPDQMKRGSPHKQNKTDEQNNVQVVCEDAPS